MDERVRERLREYQGSGDLEAGRSFLAGRLRAGELTWEAIECAAYLGDRASRDLLGEDALAFVPPRGLARFVGRLPLPDRATSLRAEAFLIADCATRAASWTDVSAAALGAAKAWLDCPCEEHLTGVRRAEERVPPRGRGRVAIDLLPFLRRILEPSGPLGVPVPDDGVGDEAELRERLTAHLLPWVLTRDAPRAAPRRAPAVGWRKEWIEEEERRQALRAARLSRAPGPEALHAGGSLDPTLARAVAVDLGPLVQHQDELELDDAVRVVEAFLLASGWRRRGKKPGRLESPSGRRRIELRSWLEPDPGCVILLDANEEGLFWPKATLAGRQIPASAAAEVIVSGVRAALDAEASASGGVTPSASRARRPRSTPARPAAPAVPRARRRSGHPS